MGYKVQFETGHEVEFDTQPTQQDIDEAYSQIKSIPISKKESALSEVGTGLKQGLQSAGATVANLGADIASTLSDGTPTQDKYIHGKINKFFGTDKKKELQTMPGIVAETAANVVPYAINLPAAGLGVAGMYNDIVNHLVEQGVPLNEARKIAITENGAMLAGGLLGGGVLGKFAGKVAGGAGGFGIGAEVGRQAHNTMLEDRPDLQNPFDAKHALANVLVGGGLGAFHPKLKKKSNAPKEDVPVDRTDPSIIAEGHTPSTQELTLLNRVYTSSLEGLSNLEKAMQDTDAEIAKSVDNVPQHLIDTYQTLQEKHRELSRKTSEIEDILSDPTQVPESAFTSNNIIKSDLMNQIKSRRKANRQPQSPEEPVTLEDQSRMYPEQETVPVETNTNVSKTSPVEVAVSRIGEAMSLPKEKLVERLQNARDALDTIDERVPKDKTPGSQYSSLKEALGQEVKAYEAILRGEKPDLGWFEGKQEPAKQTGETYEDYINRTSLSEKPTGNLAMSDVNYTDYLNHKYGAPEPVRNQHELLDGGPTREPILVDGKEIDPVLRETVSRTAKQALQHHSYQLNKVSAILENVNKQIDAYNEGKTPSGTFDLAKAIELRDALEKQVEQHRQAVENVLKHSPELREQINKPSNQIIGSVETIKEKFATIQDAIAASGDNVVNAFLDNMNLFSSKKGSEVFFDSNIPVEFQRIMRGMLETLGLNKEKIFIVDSVVNNTGRMEHFGNTTVIHLNRKALTKRFGNSAFGTLRVAAHEMGHLLFGKFLKESVTHVEDLHKLDLAFKDFIKNNKIEKSFDSDTPNVLRTQQWFHEFFAERTARALMYDHVLGKFAPKSKYLVAFSKMLSDSYTKLKRHINMSKQNFVDEIVSEVIYNNKSSIEQTGKTIWEKIQLERNDKAILENRNPEAFPFAKATLEDVSAKANEMGWYQPKTSGKVEFNSSVGTEISRRALDALGSGTKYLARKLFGKTGLAEIFKDNPIIQDVYWKIRDAEMTASKISNNLWYGDVGRQVWDKSSFFAQMSKIKDKASAYMVVKTSKPEDMAAVHDVLKKGLEEGLEYSESLDKYGATLTKEQQGIFNTLTTLFTKQYDAMVKEQTKMGKKNILPRRKGWYPSVRKGDYYIDINYQGSSAYRQHFTTKAEGEAFLQKLGHGNLKYLSATGVEKIKLEDSNPFLDSIETFKDFLESKYPPAAGILKKDVEGLVNALITRGGKLGAHHNYRTNLEGYKGSELFANAKDRGNSFKEAIQSSVGDYTGSLRKMQINHYVEPILRNNKDQMHPDTFAAIQQMSDSALNKVENKMQVVDDWVRNYVDARAKDLYDIVGKEFKPGDPVFDTVKNGILEAFYLTKLMAKPIFAVGQVISTPVQAIRHMAYDGGFRAYMSFGKGLFSLASKNKELKDSMFRVSQTTNTFEPQFIEALHLNKNDSSVLEGIKKWVFLNKVNEGADSFSRVVTYAAMYEHYKSLGKSPTEAERLAMHGTDATMVQYGSSEQAPIFKHTGIAGEMARPLQTFGQAQLANIVSDIKHFETLHPSTWAPLLTYGLTATVIGGALSPMFITEYEIIRKWLNAKYPDYSIPSVLDIVAHDGSMIDKIIPDSDLARKAVLYGLPSMSGLDLASSVRANEGFATLLMSVLMAEEEYTKLFPLVSFVKDTVQGGSTLLSEAVGNKHTQAELTKAVNQSLPVGPVSYGVKELMGLNETVVNGKPTGMKPLGNTGTAEKKRENLDIFAGAIGTRSTDDKFETQKALNRTEIDKNRQTQIKRLADLAIETQDHKYIEKILSLGIEKNALKSMIGSEVWSRLVDVETRYLVNSKGKAPSNRETARKANLLSKFRNEE